jgi:hypothetical protein
MVPDQSDHHALPDVLRSIPIAKYGAFDPLAAPVGKNDIAVDRSKIDTHWIRTPNPGRMYPHVHSIITHGFRQNQVEFLASYQVHDFCGSFGSYFVCLDKAGRRDCEKAY